MVSFCSGRSKKKEMTTFAPIFGNGAVHEVPVSGGTIAVEDSGPPAGGVSPQGVALLLPGMGDVRQSYRFLAPSLHRSGFRVLVSDLRGHGGSSAKFPSYTQPDAANDALATLNALVPDAGPVVLIGNSMSGASIVHVAGSHPDRVRAIVGLGPIPFDQSPDSIFRPVSYLLFAWPWGVSMWMSYWSTLFKGGTPPDFDSYKAALQANLGEPGRMAALGGLVRASKTPCWKLAEKVTCPALMIFGQKDPDYPDVAKAADATKAGLTASTKVSIETLEGLGHYPHVEKPDVTQKLILDFLAGIP